MISIQELSAGYDKKAVIENISLDITPNTITSIIGPNGCGKSTLLKCMAKQLAPMGGNISFNGRALAGISGKEYAQNVSYLRQSGDTPQISVEALVSHGRFPYMGFPRRLTDNDKKIVKNAMERVGVLHFRHKLLSELSGGERQKVYVAMALAQDSTLMLLDEPTTFLDIHYQLELLKLFTSLRAEGKTIVTVLHDINGAVGISDRVVLLENGRLICSDTPENVVESGQIDRVFKVHTKKADFGSDTHLLFRV